MQTSAEMMSAGKVKGLFCYLSLEEFYSFAVFGLYAQHLAELSFDLESMSKELFKSSWFSSSTPVDFENDSDVRKLTKVNGIVRKLAKKFISTKNGIRFSRYSNLEAIHKTETNPDLYRNGGILALCRVLVLNQKNIEGAISAEDIDQALAEHYDAIYSQTS